MEKATAASSPPCSPLRRSLLGAFGGLLLGCSSAPRGNVSAGAAYALTSPDRARNLSAIVPRDIAEIAIEAARITLDRMPHPIPLVRTAGLLPGEGLRTVSMMAQDDWREVRMQALAFRLSGDEAHAARAVAYLEAWMKSYSPSFNPIDETQLPSLLFGFDLIQDRLHADLVALVRAFSALLARGYLAEKVLVGDHYTERNNWHSHRMKLGTAGAFASGDSALIAAARKEFCAHVKRNIHPDGSTVDFEERDALHYVVYTLEPLLTAASCALAHGEDWYGSVECEGRIAAALDWLAPYASGQRAHDEFVGSTVAFDRKRANAGVPGFSGPFDRTEAFDVYWLAARLDERFKRVRDTISPPAAWLAMHRQWESRRTTEESSPPASWIRALFA